MAQERPPEVGPVLLVLWKAVMQGRVRPRPEVRTLLWHLVERWHELVRSQGHPKVPASTNRLESWLGRFKPWARLTRGLKTEGGSPQPLSTRLKQYRVSNAPTSTESLC